MAEMAEMMIGIDTNVLLRWLLDIPEDADQRSSVARFMETADQPIFISLPVLLETVWNMRRRYRVDREQIAKLVQFLISNRQTVIAEEKVVRDAMLGFVKHGGDFADHLIGVLNRDAGCSTTLSFDKRAARLDTFTEIT